MVPATRCAYQAEVYGVSRLHACIKRQNDSLTLSDMHSTNHTFLNGRQLKDGDICPLKNGDKTEIRGFGSFALNFRPPRTGRNPKSGERVQVPEKYVPHFKAGKELRERVDNEQK